MTSNGHKDRSKNAVRHGILSRAVVVHSGLSENTTESQAEFDAILAEWMGYYSPDGPAETLLVEEIVNAIWRKRRVLWFEAGHIAASVTLASKQCTNETEAVDDRAAILRERIADIVSAGRLTGEELKQAQEYFGHKKVVLEDWVARLKAWAAAAERESETYFNRTTQVSSAPNFDDQRTEVSVRYEAHLNHQLRQSLKMLEELQAARESRSGGVGRKPRRGASRARPKHLHVVSQ